MWGTLKGRSTRIVVLVLVALLVAAPLAATLYHHHASSSDSNCPVCHFNHQPMDRPVAGQRLPSFDVLRDQPAPVESRVVAAQSTPPIPSRAPPAA
jgi:hypothetical protein